MIGGGKWNAQNKKLNGAYINFVSKNVNKPKAIIIPDDPVVPDDPADNPSTGFLWLKDITGLVFKTSDGFNISVRK